MKKRYYLRGLGIGIFLTALIMGLAKGDVQTMTDEEVKARATELGMVEQKTLSDLADESTELPQITPEPPPRGDGPVPTNAPIPTGIPAPTEEPVPAETPTPIEEPVSTGTSTPTEESTQAVEEIVVEIVKGDSSDTISKRLEELGLVEDAKSYNRYLCDNGYDKKLNIGSYKIVKGTSQEEIAKIITRTR